MVRTPARSSAQSASQWAKQPPAGHLLPTCTSSTDLLRLYGLPVNRTSIFRDLIYDRLFRFLALLAAQHKRIRLRHARKPCVHQTLCETETFLYLNRTLAGSTTAGRWLVSVHSSACPPIPRTVSSTALSETAETSTAACCHPGVTQSSLTRCRTSRLGSSAAAWPP